MWLCLWQLAAWAVGTNLLLAGPLDTLQALWRMATRGELCVKVLWSFGRIIIGFVLAYLTALLLAYGAWRLPRFEIFLHPALLAIKSTPVVCVVVMLLIWFGAPWVSTCCVFLVVLPATYFSALEGLHALEQVKLKMLRLYRLSPLQQLGAYMWPALQSYLLASANITVGMSWKAGVAAELIGNPAGSIGERIYQAKIVLETADVFAWTIVVVVLAYVCEKLFLYALVRSADIARVWSVHSAERSMQHPYTPSALYLKSLRAVRGGKELFSDLSLSFASGSKTCLMAASGTGKTTLLQGIADTDTEALDGGEIRFEGAIALAYQKTCLLEQLSARDNVVLCARVSFAHAERLLEELLACDLLSKPVCQLSGGERQRVELVRSLAASSSVVLLDEPFSSLDEANHRRAADFILRHIEGRTLLVATHDQRDAELLGANKLQLAP